MARSKPLKKHKKTENLTDRLVSLSDPGGQAAEAYRTLRTSLLYSVVDEPPHVVAVTSPGQQEGKSTTCANLAVTLAQAEKSVLLLDCDLRKPVVHSIFELRNTRGVVDALVGSENVEELWQTPLDNLSVLTSGPVPPNPAELLGSERFGALLGDLARRFEYVLIDVPPVQVVSDAAIVAAQADGVILVFDAQSTRKLSVRRSIRTIESVGAKVLGTVMNNARPARNGTYGGYTYSYGEAAGS
ncbi:capsular exopolysaccharide family [Rubrobacter radiotolerans]|uniref:non-specific protein-tyrosine kinase n=1 Tax=Rubrobacter radiotolerans TaxID=42256 RepID=A0A023X491_RUBRA|nr:CpsD/CapB family tyrosine-protein kinase [Rubrobacter radiotolerans]AHY47011.1 capsular exopolysaccharide family [Rubrobacter radiotolerans]MDX5894417.1 CpsD/CapB family tyrosine-protein kinase [Rubrobacter radiotolerans]SMC05957.1 receptor protein-tyrosine kinase [Rubrobacter radiotolerans DSM 5868]